MERRDIEEAISEVARKHNLLLSADDPLLVTVTLNEAILHRIIARQTEAIEAAQDQISAGAAQQIETAREVAGLIITGAADYVAGEVRAAVTALKEDLFASAAAQKAEALRAAEDARQAQRGAWYAAITVLVAIGVVLGVAIGLMLDVGPGSVPARPQTNATARR
jgi:hypothetical protein